MSSSHGCRMHDHLPNSRTTARTSTSNSAEEECDDSSIIDYLKSKPQAEPDTCLKAARLNLKWARHVC